MATKNTNSVRKHHWPKPLKSVSAADGHIYYLINDDGSEGVANVTFVDFYSTLNQFAPNPQDPSASDPDGFFFVRDAASNGPDHYGDPTVHAGWAMYIWDKTKFDPVTANSGWVKISQQGDVDWDITDELKAMFVLKTVYNVKMNEIDSNFQKIEGSIIQIGARVKVLEIKMDQIYLMAHTHINKEVLDELSEPYLGILYYKGRPIGGNSYIYDHVEDVDGVKEITWCDPTKKKAEWTHEVIDTSAEIAERFGQTVLARLGLTLIVVEADGSLSLFKYTRSTKPDYEGPFTLANAVARAVELGHDEPATVTIDEVECWNIVGEPFYRMLNGTPYVLIGNIRKDSEEQEYYVFNPAAETIVPKFAQTIVQDNLGLAEYVIMLPTAAKQYVGRGCWVPVQDDGVHTVNHLHKCIKVIDDPSTGACHYEWTDVSNNGSELGVIGSVIDVCYAENSTMWTRNHLHFTIPPDTIKEGGIPVRWAKTVITRKFGSAPENANDGEIVLTVTSKSQYSQECFIDTVPYISHLKNDTPKYWFYRSFSTSMSGDTYRASEGVAAKKLDWKMLYQLAQDGNTSLVFKPGDEIYLPHHNVYGDILCEVVAVDKDASGATSPGLLVVAKDILCKKEIDAVEPNSSSGQANPESINDEGNGSNGALTGNIHDLGTLNIMVWLNSTAGLGYVQYDKTTWDRDPSYLGEAGFFGGFEDISMFGLHPALTDAHEKIDPVYVLLPRYQSFYWSNITKAKRVHHNAASEVWTTMTGVPYDGVSRKCFKFTTSDGEDTLPEEKIGIVPMFFLVGTPE